MLTESTCARTAVLGGPQRGEPDLRLPFAQGARQGLQLHFLREGGMARVVERRRRRLLAASRCARERRGSVEIWR